MGCRDDRSFEISNDEAPQLPLSGRLRLCR
jgi:hypothetical protein